MTRTARAALVLVVVALFVTGQAQAWTGEEPRPAHAALVAAYTLPLLLARRWPLAVGLLVVGATYAAYLLESPGGQAWFAVVVVVYSLGRHAVPTHAVAGMTAVAIAVLAIDVPRLQDGAPLDEVLPGWAVLAGLCGLGRWIRVRRDQAAALADRAAALERDQAEAARAAVAHERARIARELHDLVAHSMAVTVVQAQGAQRALAQDPQAARDALAAIEHLSRQGLDELRRLLGILDEQPATSPLDPPPTLARVEELVNRVRAAGLPVTLTVEGAPDGIPAGVDLSAYRIVQEGLTNALKHAGRGAHVEVALTYRPEAVEIVVADDGKGTASAPGTGRGLIGMRERVSLYGGSLQAEPRHEGGFEVRVHMPWGPVVA